MIGQVNHFRTGWYVLYTKPRHEKKVAESLTDMKLTYLLPTIRKLSVWCDRRKFINSPLFPSYIFMYLRDRYDYFNCLNVNGVLTYVKFGKEVAIVDAAIIDNIRILVNAGNDIEVTNGLFTPGQQLIINQGPLTGLSGEMIKYNGKDKLLVRVELLQRNLLVTMPADYFMSAYV